MKSVKRGRAPSMMSGITGIFMIGFGILWTVIAAQASVVFALFGVFWTGIVVVVTIYNFKNATGKNRYSEFDITDEREEPDPLNQRFGTPREARWEQAQSRFCPYCGTAAAQDHEYCSSCGKKLP